MNIYQRIERMDRIEAAIRAAAADRDAAELRRLESMAAMLGGRRGADLSRLAGTESIRCDLRAASGLGIGKAFRLGKGRR